MKNFFNFLKDIKIKYKLIFIFTLLLYILANSWFLSFTTISDVEQSFSELEEKSLPTLEATITLKDKLEESFFAVYDYILTGDTASKDLYNIAFKQAIEAEITLFEVGYTEEDFEFVQSFNEQLVNINTELDNLIQTYEQDPNSDEVDQKLESVISTKNDFMLFVDSELSAKVSQEIQDSNEKISQTADRITIYLVIVLSGIVIIVIFLIIFIRSNITKPINKLIEAAEEFGKGNFVKIDLKRKDEIGVFSETFNRMGRDINRTHEELKTELTKTKELDKQKSEFLSIAAHQLRTPMAGIKWVINMVHQGDMGKVTKEQKHFLSRALENSERMIRLINDLLDITSLEEQKFQYKFEKCDLYQMIKTIIEENNEVIIKKKLDVGVKRTKELKTEIACDSKKLKIAIINLIENAIKYSSPKGHIDITVEESNKLLLIKIKDDGIGIPEKQKNYVFTKFFRGKNVMKVETEGSGLGLYLAKDIINKHDGNIWFESKEDMGTTFFVTLPYIHKK
ncbi:MAG: ATP-binding protein [Patescibacteria group bacterium]